MVHSLDGKEDRFQFWTEHAPLVLNAPPGEGYFISGREVGRSLRLQRFKSLCLRVAWAKWKGLSIDVERVPDWSSRTANHQQSAQGYARSENPQS